MLCHLFVHPHEGVTTTTGDVVAVQRAGII
jgi:hypothetical protein